MSDHQKERFNIALYLCETLVNEENVIGVYVWGSTAEGRATKMSDLDLVAITRRREDYKIYLFGDVAVTVDYLPLYLIRKAIKEENLWVIESLRNCIALDDKYRIIKKLRSRALDYYPRNAIDDKFRQASLEIKDAMDLFNLDNYEGAILAAHKSAEMLITAILYSKGILRVKPKWTLQDINRIECADSLEISRLFKQVMGLENKRLTAKKTLFDAVKLYYITRNVLQKIEQKK